MRLSFTEKKRIRRNYGKLREILPIPNLIEVQKKSYNQFLTATNVTDSNLQKGLDRVFKNLYFIDWVSYYCAILNNTNPYPVDMIAKLKKML